MLEREKIRVKKKISKKADAFSYDMLVFSHLRWDFVYQRPQHLISRISRKHKTLFIEEPIPPNENEGIGFETQVISPYLSILKPRVHAISDIAKILARLNVRQVNSAWFYSAAFYELLNTISADHIIYDCMDELSLFKGASQLLKDQEKKLLNTADLVLTGGISLYEEKSKHNPNVHCFPSSVDCEHFEKAKRNLMLPSDIKNIQHPIVGYIGVIDERIDMPLIQQTAELLPEFNFVMIGPLAKIEEKDLAKAENIHYLGMKDYDVLPNYLKAFDVAMMPFALNDSTRFISPTKTLEYMAAGKPIISTSIKDVVRQYNHCVEIIESPDEFKQAIVNAISSRKNQIAAYQKILEKTSWDNTASKMLNLLNIMKSPAA